MVKGYREDLMHEGPIVVELRNYHQGFMMDGTDDELRGLRYFTMLQTDHNFSQTNRFDGVWFSGRMAVDERFHSTNVWATWVIPASIEPDDNRPMRMIIKDYSLSAGLWLGEKDGHYFAIGGQDVRVVMDEGDIVGDRLDDRDGLRVLEADSFDSILANTSWLHPSHASRTDHNIILKGDHPGCVTARHTYDGVCEYDGKPSAVFFHGHWYVYHRANVKMHGGRYVQVAKSVGKSIYGPYEPLQLITIQNYDPYDGHTQWSNIYFMNVNQHPLDSEVLLALMPINWGEDDVDNADGPATVAMSFSCDGVAWSSITNLLDTTGRLGRTYDQPVDGLMLHDGVVHWYLHRDVPNISPDAVWNSAIIEFAFDTAELNRLTTEAKATLSACRRPWAPPFPPASSHRSPPPSPAPTFKPSQPPPHARRPGAVHFTSPHSTSSAKSTALSMLHPAAPPSIADRIVPISAQTLTPASGSSFFIICMVAGLSLVLVAWRRYLRGVQPSSRRFLNIFPVSSRQTELSDASTPSRENNPYGLNDAAVAAARLHETGLD